MAEKARNRYFRYSATFYAIKGIPENSVFSEMSFSSEVFLSSNLTTYICHTTQDWDTRPSGKVEINKLDIPREVNEWTTYTHDVLLNGDLIGHIGIDEPDIELPALIDFDDEEHKAYWKRFIDYCNEDWDK